MEKNQLPEKLDQLLVNNDFNSLNELEKNYVLRFVSKEEYTSYHHFLTKTLSSNNHQKSLLSLPPQIREQLTTSFRKKKEAAHSQNSFKLPYLALNIPYYQPIAVSIAAIALFIVIPLINKESNNNTHYLSNEEFNKHTQVHQPYIETEDEITAQLMELEFQNE